MKRETRNPNGSYQRLGIGYDYQFEVVRHREASMRKMKRLAKITGAGCTALCFGWLVAEGYWSLSAIHGLVAGIR